MEQFLKITQKERNRHKEKNINHTRHLKKISRNLIKAKKKKNSYPTNNPLKLKEKHPTRVLNITPITCIFIRR